MKNRITFIFWMLGLCLVSLGGRAGLAVAAGPPAAQPDEAGDCLVLHYSETGEFIGQWALPYEPAGLAIGPNGDVYVNINQNHRIVQYSASGEYLGEWEVPGVIETNGIAVGPSGDVYVNINQNYRVVRYSATGNFLGEWEVPGVIETNGMAVGPNGDVYVNINQNYRVVHYSASGAYLGEWQVVAGRPLAIAVGPGSSSSTPQAGSSAVVYVSTGSNWEPYQPANPLPVNQAVLTGLPTSLSWSGGDPDGDPVTYNVYGQETAALSATLWYSGTSTSFAPGAGLQPGASYLWWVEASDPWGGQSSSPAWSFTTGAFQSLYLPVITRLP